MNHSAIQLAGSSERIFRAWRVLRQTQVGDGATRKQGSKPGPAER
ncbi:hypothetical protein ACFOZ5_09040 [Marinobacter lacisalsi]|uniref:Uncharacterized protein n=1 Tax=Marinobacter lacisalsi TaxID=475979 RepID=A0ABV8QG68_9GAMM